MKIVLALVPVWDSITPPLSLAFLKSSLNEAGYDCRCIDFSAQFRPMMVSVMGDLPAQESIAKQPKLYENWARQIYDEKPDVVGFSLLMSNLNNTALVAIELKKMLPDVVIVSGGPSLTRQNQDTIEQAYKFSDYIIEGEGENLMVDFVKCIENKDDIHKVKQVWLENPDGTVYYTGSGIQQNIDTIPLPDFSDFNLTDYKSPERLPMLFSRGCILNCNYCENKWNHLTQRTRSGRLVFEELKRNVNQYHIKEYMFNDDSLISRITYKELETYCDLVISEGLEMPWSVYGTRVEKMLNQPYVNKLKRTGMDFVTLGVESFSTEVQHAMGKSSRYDDADKTCRLFADEGIKTAAWIIYGYPTETDEDFKKTLNWFIQNPDVLSHATVNSFGLNAKYMFDRPNVAQYFSNKQWDWASKESTIEKRKARFLLLIDVLETIRKSRKGAFSFHFGDPLYVKYFTKWGRNEKSFLFDRWAELEEGVTKPKGLAKLMHVLGFTKANSVQAIDGFYTAEKTEGILRIRNTSEELREQLYEKIKVHLINSNGRSPEEQNNKLTDYKIKLQNVISLTSPTVPENVFFAISLKGSIEKMLSDLDSISPDELSDRVIKQMKLFRKIDAPENI